MIHEIVQIQETEIVHIDPILRDHLQFQVIKMKKSCYPFCYRNRVFKLYGTPSRSRYAEF